MPDRYLREALLRSDRWNACSLDAREFFYRLISVVDDYGCFDGRPAIIASRAYPLGRIDAPPLEELHRAGLVVRYTNAGKPFIAVMQWGERGRGARKYPAPPICNELRGVNYQGFFGREMLWADPEGCDPVSTLIDHHGRQVVPQPAEWRDVEHDHWPLFALDQWERYQKTRAEKALAPKPYRAHQAPKPRAPSPVPQAVVPKPYVVPEHEPTVTGPQGLGTVQRSSVVGQRTTASPSSSDNDITACDPSPAASTPANGKITLLNGPWQGVSDEQALQWQAAFDTLSIPDQLDHAAAWLQANAEARAAIASGLDSCEAFLVRWLLREARGTARAKGSVDA